MYTQKSPPAEEVTDDLQAVPEHDPATLLDGATGKDGRTSVEVAAVDEGLFQMAGQEDIDDDELLRQELARLKTGEDVIAFFAKNGSNTTTKFVYCRRRELVTETEFRPYDLEVIPEMMDQNRGMTYAPSKLGEHFTISATGVVYVCPGQQSEYMPLANWMHE